nr:tRNA adenosine deaminase-associated protein [Nocardioides ferulae]
MRDFEDAVDFALAVFREEGAWQVESLTHDHLGDLETLAGALGRFPGDAGVLGLVAFDEDYFVVVRVTGPFTRVLLSDLTAADEWELASSVLESLGLPLPDDDDQVPAGDLEIFDDLGISTLDLAALLDDVDLYPDELLSEVARQLGFGPLFDDAVGLTPA